MRRESGVQILTTRRFPKALRVEAKFTTGTTIAVPKREREALLSKDQDVVGVIAALFWCGTREVEGRWFIVDAAESFRSGPADGGSFGVQDLQRIEKGQTWLAGVRQHVEQTWPAFLRAFREAALAGHEVLRTELDVLQKAGKLRDRLTVEPVLELEHRETVRTIIESLGPAVAGHVFQDLLAYLLALAGYDKIQINPVGVPDIEVSELRGRLESNPVTLSITRQQAVRLVKVCQAAGESELVKALTLELEER
jgi:hypothetical protein